MSVKIVSLRYKDGAVLARTVDRLSSVFVPKTRRRKCGAVLGGRFPCEAHAPVNCK